ncbi:MAG: hypothetical protein Q9210_001277 [Variospora velana]
MYIIDPKESAILGALDVLCNVHEDGLKPYKAKVQEVFQKLQHVESCPGSPCIQQLASTSHNSSAAQKARQNRPADGDAGGLPAECKIIASSSKTDRRTRVASSGCIPTTPATTQQPVASGDNNVSPYNHNPFARHADPSYFPKHDYVTEVLLAPAIRLLDTLKSDFETIGRVISELNPDDTVLERQILSTDARLHDIVIAKGVESERQGLWLRRGLSQRSLAIEFDSWDRDKNGGTSSLDKRIKAQKEKGILQFTRTKCPQKFTEPRFDQEYSATVRKVIQSGIKLLYFERALEGRGFLTIFVFRCTKWQRVPYGDLGQLAHAFRSQALTRDVAELWADWLDPLPAALEDNRLLPIYMIGTDHYREYDQAASGSKLVEDERLARSLIEIVTTMLEGMKVLNEAGDTSDYG